MRHNREFTMYDNISTYAEKAGAPPETLVYTGDFCQSVRITAIGYGPDRWLEKEIRTPGDLDELKEYPVTWLNVDGVCDVELVKRICDYHGVHPLVQEDILHTGQRPKVEEFEDYVFCVLKMLSYDAENIQVDSEQISLILLKNTVISFQEKPGDVFDLIRNRIRSGRSKICNFGPDYLLYSLLDAIVDEYFLILEEIGEQIDDMEEDLLDDPEPIKNNRIYLLKRELLVLRKSIWPVREMVNRLDKTESELIADSISIYLRDVYDHVVHAIDTIETLRDMLLGILDSYLSSTNNRLGEVMKLLTIISTIFIPLTFITGIYGMNFDFLPGSKWQYGVHVAVGLMVTIGLGMLIFFRRKKWI